MKIRTAATIAAATLALAACSAEQGPPPDAADAATTEQEQAGPPPDAAELLALIVDDVPVWLPGPDCDTETIIDMAGFGKASCIVADSELRVGQSTNLLQVVVFEDTAHMEELAYDYEDTPIYISDQWAITAPSQELADEMGALLEERD